MQELLPAKQRVFDDIKAKIEKTYRLHGFQHIETPTIDRNEILFAKAGGDTEKQIYRVVKTDEPAEASNESLRFDHTVPLARYVVEHESELNFPFRVFQIGRNFRGERAQRGRFREFYQCDVDIIGRNELPLVYDSQVIYTFYNALKSFVETPIKIRINNRKYLNAILDSLGVSSHAAEIYSIIDHAEKVPAEKTAAALKSLNLSEDNVVKITTLINTHGDYDTIARLGYENAGLAELKQICDELTALGLQDSIEIDLKIVRGLDYYTGTVFEAVLPEHPELGSVGGGGRYDNLASNYTDMKFPGVGASIGLSRLFYVLSENNLLSDGAYHNAQGDSQSGTKDGNQNNIPPLDYSIIPLDASARSAAYAISEIIRKNDKTADIILMDKKLADRLKHAAKISKYGIVLGENEVKAKRCKIKNFATREEAEFDFSRSGKLPS